MVRLKGADAQDRALGYMVALALLRLLRLLLQPGGMSWQMCCLAGADTVGGLSCCTCAASTLAAGAAASSCVVAVDGCSGVFADQ